VLNLAMKNFKPIMHDHQENWKLKKLPHITLKGWQNAHQYDHVLPKLKLQENFYPPIRLQLFAPAKGYLAKMAIKPHTGIHNFLSSWALCANMYWPFNNPEGKKLLAEYLKIETNLDIYEITELELEFEDIDDAYKPANILGEDTKGGRGSGQTSPDLAILFKNSNGDDGVLLIECKFTEHNFYACSGYKYNNPEDRLKNESNEICKNTKALLKNDFRECNLQKWNRKYWDLLKHDLNRLFFESLDRCPMSTCCYQLFRQQALAKGLEKKYKIVASCVAMDERNSTLINSGKRTGLKPFPQGWQELFPGLPFYWFTHQAWFEFVKANNAEGRWDEWIDYIGERYFYLT
jgi:hypothetical protein